MKRILALILALCLLTAFLGGCGWSPAPTPTAEELLENIAKDPAPDKTDVVAIFETWQLPDFYSYTFQVYMRAYADRMEQHGVSSLTLARMAAEDFVRTEYDALDLHDTADVTSALLACYERAAETLCPPLSDEEALRAVIGTGDTEHDFAAMYLLQWGFPSFLTQKFMTVERVFSTYFYKEMDEPSEIAQTLAGLFLDEMLADTDLTDLDAVTDAYLDAYVELTGDPYAVYRDAEEYEIYEDDRYGTYVGIGVTVQRNADDTIQVVGLNDKGPAKGAGIAVGDLIYAVDGRLVEDMGYDATVAAVRGEIGTEVTVTVKRGDELLDFTIVRVSLTDVTVSWSVNDDGIGYISITDFKLTTAAQFREAIDAMEEAQVQAIVFDLRSNLGGALDAVTSMLSYLVPRGTPIVSFSSKFYSPIYSSDDHVLPDVPVVVLCNEYTASAGELFTAALRDYSTDAFGLMDATVVGVKTYKKGVMQTTFTMFDDSSITLTVSLYNPPSGVNYDGIGVIPDVEVELGADGTDAQLERAYDILLEKLGAAE